MDMIQGVFFGGRYAKPWPEILKRETGFDVINLGENGREIPHREAEIDWLDTQIEKELPADLLVIHLGSNDYLNLWNGDLNVVVSRMDEYLEHVKKRFKSLKVLLLEPLELAHGYDEIAKKHGVKIGNLCELNLPFSTDGIHLTEEGHEVLAKRVKELVDTL